MSSTSRHTSQKASSSQTTLSSRLAMKLSPWQYPPSSYRTANAVRIRLSAAGSWTWMGTRVTSLSICRSTLAASSTCEALTMCCR